MSRTALAIALLLSSGASAQELRTGTDWYTVRPGDSCWSIATRLYGEGKRYSIIHKHNDLGPMPHLLEPGQKLRLPGRGVRPDAEIDWVVADVKTKPPRQRSWVKARRNTDLFRLYKVATGDESAAGILFEDTSRLHLRENALLVIYGASARKNRVRPRKAGVTLERGTLRGGLTSMDGASKPMIVATPAATIKLLSREVQVEVSRDRTSHVSVYDGFAEVRNRKGKVEVPRDYGTVVKPGKRPRPPRRLPRPPTWQSRGLSAVVIVPRAERALFEARWSRTARAARYRFELSRDPSFARPMMYAVVGAGITRFRVHDLAPGEYFARVAAIDSDRLEGRPSAPLKIRVVPLKSTRALRGSAADGLVVTGWVGLDVDEAVRAEITPGFGQDAFHRARWPLRLYRPGRYTLRFRHAGSQQESKLKLHVLAISAKLEGAGIALPGDSLVLRLLVRDERGEAATPPDLALHAEGVGPLILTPAGAGDWTATLKVPTDYSKTELGLSAGWAGGELVSTTLVVTQFGRPKRKPVLPVPSGRHTDPVSTEGAVPSGGLPAQSARATTSFGFSSFGAESPLPGGPTILRTSLRGELALPNLALTVDAPFFNAEPTPDPVAGNELGDLRLGARWLGIVDPDLVVAVGLRLTLPTGGFARAFDDLVIEPQVLVDGDPTPELRLGMHQAFPLATDFTDHATFSWSSAYWFSWLGLEWLELVGEVDMVVPFEDEAKRVAFMAGTAVRFLIGPVRLGVSAAGALTAASADRFGAWRAGLTLDVYLTP